jgi:phage prohead protease, HK97 family|nr:MAG TPA: prohead serine protease [Caudoviricetes sp.]DAU79045.1 MAG TPA: prohead serine protease [Caudoviricetes sp.]
MDRECRQMRSVPSMFDTREENDVLYIEGYFSVFNTNYDLWPGASESVAPGAFSKTLGGDIRALIDHETRLVLGRNKAGTLELKEDSHGLWGRVSINRNDQDAMNLYERVKRRDVDQCSFGFEIVKEDTEIREDGSVHWTIREVKLYEVSVVTFPAYEETSVSARKKEFADIQRRKTEAWRETMQKKIRSESKWH